MAIRCGSCKDTHPTVTDVRECYGAARPVQQQQQQQQQIVTNGVTEKQLAFLNKLLDERPAFRDIENLWPSKLVELTKRDASLLIDRVLDTPKEMNAVAGPAAEVADGHYALIEDGIVKFFRVKTPTKGKWSGRTFVDIQASDEFHAIRDRKRRTWVLNTIAANPLEALTRYGFELGKCGVCNRTLTDPESIAAGIGPVCASKF